MKWLVSSIAAALATLAAVCVALADSYPLLVSELEIELDAARRYRADPPLSRLHDLSTDTKADLALQFDPYLAVRSRLRLDTSKEATGSRAFGDESLFVEELHLSYERAWYGFLVGKFNPHFGTAWDAAPGVFGSDFAQDYEITEGIGAAASATWETSGWGNHKLVGGMFFADRTPLANTLFARPRSGADDVIRPGRRRLGDGGVANTRAPGSFSLTLEGEEIPVLNGFTYHLGLMRRAAGSGDQRDEWGYVVGLRRDWPVAAGLKLAPLVEYVLLDGAAGQHQRIHYLTTAAELTWTKWLLSLSHTSRIIDEPADGSGPRGNDFHDRLLTTSIGYAFHADLVLSGGWKRERIESLTSQTVGLKLTYNLRN